MTIHVLKRETFTSQDVCIPIQDMELDTSNASYSGALKIRLEGNIEAPLIAVLGGISAGRTISGPEGWWRQIVGKDQAIDLNQYCVLGIDFLPGDDEASKHAFITTGDQARALTCALKHLDRTQFHAIIGSSYGGMVALQFAARYPDLVGRIAVYGASHHASQMSVARRSLQRKIIRLASRLGDASAGLALARELAMTTYRSHEEFEARFTAPEPGKNGEIAAGVNDYLAARGGAFQTVMTAERFMTLSRSIDLHTVHPEDVSIPAYLLACRQDQIVPVSDMRKLQARLQGTAILTEFDSIYGHDAFLKETGIVSAFLQSALNGGE